MEYKKFINVYHFAPLSYEICDRQNALERNMEKTEELYTGKIQVRLKTRTPVFIPDMHAQGKETGHKELTFFSYDGKTPVIPGSSLRGMLRSVYETVTNSCLSVVDLEEKPVRRTSDCYKAGLLRRNVDNTFTLVSANKATVLFDERPDLRQPEKYQEGAEVWVKVGNEGRRQIVTKILPAGGVSQGKWHEGYYFKGEPGVKKIKKSENAYVIYRKDIDERERETEIESCKCMERNSVELQELKSVLESYEALLEKKKNDKDHKQFIEYSKEPDHKGYKEYSKRLETFLAGESGTEYFPVHYSTIGKGKDAIVYLSPACITKEISYNTILDILKKQGKHHTCSNIKKLCPACRLFGMVGDNQKVEEKDDYPNAWASSIRVQDAVLKEEPPNGWRGQKITLMELSEPKKSSAEFYLKKPKGEQVLSWTYDYYIYGKLGKKKKEEKEERRHVKQYTPQISGRKYYWHTQEPNLPEKFVEKTERNCTVTLLNGEAVFEFPIYFEKITKMQLKQLIWICNISMTLGADGYPMYGYKLGKGKPLGLGSIELTVKDVQIRCLEKDGRLHYHLESYKERFGQDYQELTYEGAGFDEEVKEAFLRLCRFDATVKFPATYPVSNRQSVKIAWDGYEWFTCNRYNAEKGGNKRITKRNELVFEQFFTPLTGENEITLYVNTKREQGYPNAQSYKGVAASDEIIENPSKKADEGKRDAGNQERNRNGSSANRGRHAKR